MLSASFMPSPAVRHLARCYHIRHFVLQHNITAFKPYPARPEQSLVFFPRHPEIVEYVGDGTKLVRPGAMMMSQYTARTNRHIAGDFLAIIIELQPGVLHRLSGLPMHHVTNTDVEAGAALSREISRVSERLNSTGDYAEMIRIIEAMLLQFTFRLMHREHAVDKVAHFILSQKGNTSVDWLADQACLSMRQLERKFKERVGVGPKTFSRLTRMHETYKLKSAGPDMDWLDIALRCGYHDYQHLAKDYREFAGCYPNELFHEQRTAPESLCGLSETFST